MIYCPLAGLSTPPPAYRENAKRRSPIDIQQLLTRLEELFDHGLRLPLSNKVAVDEETFYGIIEQMWLSIPPEIKQADELRLERDRIIAQAQEEARRIIAQAREDAAKQLDRHDLHKTAEAQAQALLTNAKEEAAKIRFGADEYAEARLKQLREYVGELQKVIRNGLEELARRRDRSDQPSDAEGETLEMGEVASEAATTDESVPEES